ncbi:TPM domain-containing protein [Niabella aurantiaca]|uniref:TPM domain-containing protein n=1 Tax=Niabella aurantiaca TaxID=379900 RepID=UPI00146D117F|nr:TPM domain-containing protein [Niabella aurantiaca]
MQIKMYGPKGVGKTGLFLLALFFLTMGQAQDVLKISTRTTDRTGTLSPADIKDLNEQLYTIEQHTGRQVVVVMIPTTGALSVEDYATELFRKNGIGSKERNDGVLILVAKNDRKMRIEVGYGLEGTITDLVAGGIINKKMKPYFKDDEYGAGLKEAVTTIGALLNGSVSDQEVAELKYGNSGNSHLTKDGRALLWVLFLSLISGVLVGLRKLKPGRAACLILGGVLLAALLRWNLGLLIGLIMLAPFPAFGGFALVRYRAARMICLVLMALIGAFWITGMFFGPDVMVIGMVALFVLAFIAAFIFAAVAGIKGGGRGTSGSRSGWSSSGSSSWSSSSSHSSFSGGGGSSGGGGASGSW